MKLTKRRIKEKFGDDYTLVGSHIRRKRKEAETKKEKYIPLEVFFVLLILLIIIGIGIPFFLELIFNYIKENILKLFLTGIIVLIAGILIYLWNKRRG